jgi:hypothetical protein
MILFTLQVTKSSFFLDVRAREIGLLLAQPKFIRIMIVSFSDN